MHPAGGVENRLTKFVILSRCKQMLPTPPPTGQPESADDARRARILEGAMSVFLAYGFQRTTMDDIARAADISRPALYLQFRNKTDIYRALAQRFLADIIGRARLAMAEKAPLAARLADALHGIHEMTHEIEVSQHGAEMLDMRNKLAADIVGTGRAEFRTLLEAAIAAEVRRPHADAGRCGVAPGLLADCLLDAIDGMKLRGLAADAQRTAIDAYVAIVTRAAAG